MKPRQNLIKSSVYVFPTRAATKSQRRRRIMVREQLNYNQDYLSPTRMLAVLIVRGK